MDNDIAVLRCHNSHTILWPRDLTPYPDKCPAEVEAFRHCREELRRMGYATFTLDEEALSSNPNTLIRYSKSEPKTRLPPGYLIDLAKPEPI